MSSKKKLVISLSVAAAVLVAAIIAIVAVFAAAQQTVKSSVKVSFKARNVDCTITGFYQTNLMDSESSAFDLVRIEADDDGTETHNANVPAVTLYQAGDEDIFLRVTYTITNHSPRAMSVKLAGLASNEWFDVDFAPSGVTEDADGVVIDSGDSEDFTIMITPTQLLLNSAEDVDAAMDVNLMWTLDAIAYTEPADPDLGE